ncbi:MAG: hypothetical protein V1672_01960 [Candidatus Diapherotrites archaeon]
MKRVTIAIGRKVRGFDRHVSEMDPLDVQEQRKEFVNELVHGLNQGSAHLILQKSGFSDERKVVQFLDTLPKKSRAIVVKEVGDARKNIAPSPEVPAFLEILNDAYRLHSGLNKTLELRKDHFLYGDMKKFFVPESELTKHIKVEKTSIEKNTKGFAVVKGGEVKIPPEIKRELEARADHLLKVYWNAVEKIDFERAYDIHREMLAFRKEVDRFGEDVAGFTDAGLGKIIPAKRKMKK